VLTSSEESPIWPWQRPLVRPIEYTGAPEVSSLRLIVEQMGWRARTLEALRLTAFNCVDFAVQIAQSITTCGASSPASLQYGFREVLVVLLSGPDISVSFPISKL
jgi:hypothetical protein